MKRQRSEVNNDGGDASTMHTRERGFSCYIYQISNWINSLAFSKTTVQPEYDSKEPLIFSTSYDAGPIIILVEAPTTRMPSMYILSRTKNVKRSLVGETHETVRKNLDLS
jgi:hypothetical protein